MAHHETSQILAGSLVALGGMIATLAVIGGVVGGLMAAEADNMPLLAILAGSGLLGLVTGLLTVAAGSALWYLEELRDHVIPPAV